MQVFENGPSLSHSLSLDNKAFCCWLKFEGHSTWDGWMERRPFQGCGLSIGDGSQNYATLQYKFKLLYRPKRVNICWRFSVHAVHEKLPAKNRKAIEQHYYRMHICITYTVTCKVYNKYKYLLGNVWSKIRIMWIATTKIYLVLLWGSYYHNCFRQMPKYLSTYVLFLNDS
jgi:hypothetical protein